MGYLPLPYNKDRNKVFYKEMDNGLIVCVGIESSSLYQDRRKTVSFYYCTIGNGLRLAAVYVVQVLVSSIIPFYTFFSPNLLILEEQV